MRIQFALLLLLHLLYVVESAPPPGIGSGCRSYKPAKVDEEWLLSIGKWYITYTDELSTSSMSNPSISDLKPSPQQQGKAKKLCYTSSFKVAADGNGLPTLPISYNCEYYGNVSKQVCQIKEMDQAPEPFSLIFALLPTSIDMVIVQTDNSKYICLLTCISSVVKQFSVLSTEPQGPGEEIMKAIKKKYGGLSGAAADRVRKVGKGSKIGKKSSTPGKETIIIDNCRRGTKTDIEKGAAALKKMDKLGVAERLGPRSGSSGVEEGA